MISKISKVRTRFNKEIPYSIYILAFILFRRLYYINYYKVYALLEVVGVP